MTAIPFAKQPSLLNIYCDLVACNKLCNSDHINSTKFFGEYITVTKILVSGKAGQVSHYCDEICWNEAQRRMNKKINRNKGGI